MSAVHFSGVSPVRFSAWNGSLFNFEQFTFQVWITNQKKPLDKSCELMYIIACEQTPIQ